MHLPVLYLLLFLLGSSAKAGEIIGGTECIPHSRPYMAYLEIKTSENHLSACSGFLIRRNFVMTAAHCAGRDYRTAPPSVYTALCIKPKSSHMLGKHSSSSASILPHNRSITVLLGAHNRKGKEDTWQRLEVENQFPHPEYDDHLNLNDIMLLKLKEKANLTLGVGTLPFSAEFKSITPGRVCRAVGWGKTNVNEPASDTLREVKMRILDPQNCNHFPDFHDKLQLCVGKKMRNVYKGDSGGPLLCAGIAQGIVSYGHRNAKPPAVFTRISHYRPWINKILREN